MSVLDIQGTQKLMAEKLGTEIPGWGDLSGVQRCWGNPSPPFLGDV